jgi:hypothetical protein
MKLTRAIRLTTLGLAGYGGYTLWSRYGERIRALVGQGDHGEAVPSARRIRERSELTAEEWSVGSDDPVAQAAAILSDSDVRSRLPRTAEGIEHRRSQDTVEP